MNQLGPKHYEYIRHRMAGKPCAVAARLAGFSDAYAHHASEHLERHPLIAAELDKHRKALAEKTGYDAQAAMTELEQAMEFAKTTENATALVRAVELRSKLNGLLVEKIDQRNLGNFQIRISGIDDPKPEPRDITPPKDTPP